VCVGAVVVRHDALLMIQRGSGGSRGRWSLPGGHLEGGESVAEGVVRELKEETGVDGLCGAFLGWAEHVSEHAHYVILNFEAVVLGESLPRPGSDELAADWVALWRVPELELTEGLAEFLADHDIIELLI